jgi:hypothetical protein
MLATLLIPKRNRILPSSAHRATTEPTDKGYLYLDPAYDQMAAEEEEQQEKQANSKPRYPTSLVSPPVLSCPRLCSAE